MNMKEIQIFSAKWDTNFNHVVSDIKKVIKENNLENEVSVKIFDVDDPKNSRLFKNHIKTIEKRVGIPENPTVSVPLVAIDGEPFCVGIGPTFKKKLAKRM